MCGVDVQLSGRPPAHLPACTHARPPCLLAATRAPSRRRTPSPQGDSPDSGPSFIADVFFLTQLMLHVGPMPTVYR